MNYFHQELAAGRWFELSLVEQMANVGSEVIRMLKWQKKNSRYAQLAFERALELLDLTIQDTKNKKQLKEIVRVREVLADFYFENNYQSNEKSWYNYFYAFNYAARLNH